MSNFESTLSCGIPAQIECPAEYNIGDTLRNDEGSGPDISDAIEIMSLVWWRKWSKILKEVESPKKAGTLSTEGAERAASSKSMRLLR
jgi:hypothetical protein